ncbi:hypothetical protein [Nonomuraea gerenzanensis]|uniref:hypothetical protein n=1 Tax=Nonomuraea gerenzanensis TaxID=93944 RepID=UPI001CDA1086|nr:hypothetical protein [Nonomuraea gerenzanensis]UBU13311.1 hypothetical protein LCN96_55305 [Nonomuraea gerenzanensis]
MTRVAVQRLRAKARAARRPRVTVQAVPAQGPTTGLGDRMARFAAGARRVVVRAVAIGALVAAGWLLAVVFGTLAAAPAAADATAATGAAGRSTGTNPADTTAATGTTGSTDTGTADATAVTGAAGSSGGTAQHGLTAPVSASDNAEAMAGRTVDGLNSQRDPGLPAPSSAGKILDTDGLVPNGGGSGPFGPATGDAVRSAYDPRLQAGRVPVARLLPPVVRTAADDPSFSPD